MESPCVAQAGLKLLSLLSAGITDVYPVFNHYSSFLNSFDVK
jgi:hypothetical protein